jgi:hypothetical protein
MIFNNIMIKIKNISLGLIVILALVFALPAFAQEERDEVLELRFNRDFGYGGFEGDIQGRFSIKVISPEDIVRVEYFIDGERVYEGTEFPFKWQFNTDSYSEGRHTFSATGYKADGTEIYAQEFTRVFLSADSAWDKTGDFIVPLLVIVGLAALAGTLGPALLGRKKIHTPGSYGMAGGAICPRCTFPYSRNILAPNLVVGKLERCPHCGKWAIVPRASTAALEEAEARLASEGESTIETQTEEEKLRQMIDDSRFDD